MGAEKNGCNRKIQYKFESFTLIEVLYTIVHLLQAPIHNSTARTVAEKEFHPSQLLVVIAIEKYYLICKGFVGQSTSVYEPEKKNQNNKFILMGR